MIDNKLLMVRLLDQFVKDCFNEELALGKIIDGTRVDSIGVPLFIAIEKWIKVWIKLFLIDKSKVNDYFDKMIHDKYIFLNNVYLEDFKIPSIEEIDEGYDEAVDINFPILKEEYMEKTFYKWIDDFIDKVCSEHNQQIIYMEHGDNYPEGIVKVRGIDF